MGSPEDPSSASEFDAGPQDRDAYHLSSGGWGSVRAVAGALFKQPVSPRAPAILLKQNKPGGFMCVSCFEQTDLMFFFGQNVGTNSPRMLHQLQAARRRGVPIITFNPLREPGLVSFTNPQSPAQMLTPGATAISTQYHQLKTGGDLAALTGLCKAVLHADSGADSQPALDWPFIEEHTTGFDAFREFLDRTSWTTVERVSGLTRSAIEAAAAEYVRAGAAIAHYGMGVTQHRLGVDTVRMLVNLLLLRGNIGKPGAGISPIRGHSNVQGQRTVGITEKPELAPLDELAGQFGFEPPRRKGFNAVEACEAILDGTVRAVIQLGGNLVRSLPDHSRIVPAWRRLDLTVMITTKLNRSHLVHGRHAYLLPCLSRIEIDQQAGGPQAVSMEDSTGCIHGSRGVTPPIDERLMSEPAMIAELAKATVGTKHVDWDAWRDDYGLAREAIARTYPDTFHDFNGRLWTPGGFGRPNGARERLWKTASGKAEFAVPQSLDADPDMRADGDDVVRLFTLRSDNQFDTTIYDYGDRFRGIEGTRSVVLMNPQDVSRLGLTAGDEVVLRTVADDGVDRSVAGLQVVAYDVPAGCAAGYYPECNPLIPLWHHARESKVPAAKAIPVRVSRAAPIDSPPSSTTVADGVAKAAQRRT